MCEADLLPLTSNVEVKIDLNSTFTPAVCLHVLDKKVFSLRETDRKGMEKIQQTVGNVVPLWVMTAYESAGMKLSHY
jgi:hypothetical protein